MMARRKAILVDNGINRVAGNPSWPTLLRRVFTTVAGHRWRHQFGDAPYPLIYEQLLLKARKRLGWSERRLKEQIASEVSLSYGDELHQQIMQLSATDILTTNYDQALEATVGGASGRLNSGEIFERRYSLFRYRLFDSGKRLWYIHGDVRIPGSILLGYDQYSGYLQQMRLYTTTGLEYSSWAFAPLVQSGKIVSGGHSWIDLFFTTDIWIVGLGLEFIEIHLWWLLAFRARHFALNRRRKNRIVYMCHATDSTRSTKHAKLEQFGVEVLKIGSRSLSYRTLLERAFHII